VLEKHAFEPSLSLQNFVSFLVGPVTFTFKGSKLLSPLLTTQ
jgi:hypothetical protein